MRISAGATVGPALARSLEPALRALRACAGAQGGACLYEQDGAVSQASSALDIVRQVAGARHAQGAAALILRETLFDADRDLGDGGARLALLLGALFREGVRLVAAGVPAPALADALLALSATFDLALAESAVPCADEPSLVKLAHACGAAPELAADLARLVLSVGAEGHAEIVTGRERGGRIELGTGFVFEAQAVAEIFASAAFDPVHLLVADEIIDDFGPLVPLLEGFATRGKSLLVIARDVTGTALQTLIANRRDNGLRTAALKPAAVSQQAADALEDLAIATGATLVADRFGTSLKALRPSMLGRAARFSFSQGRMLLEAPDGDAAAVESRRHQLLTEAEQQKYLSLDKERLERRAARLSGGWGRLHIHEATGRETDAALARARRALASMRMALEGGAAPGGGIGLVRAFDRLPTLAEVRGLAPEAAARRCLAVALAELVRGLEANRSHEPGPRLSLADGASLAERLGMAHDGPGAVLDPLPLLRQVSRRAISGAATMLRIDAIIGS